MKQRAPFQARPADLAAASAALLLTAACTGGETDDGKDAAAGYDPAARPSPSPGGPVRPRRPSQGQAEGLAAEYNRSYPNVTIGKDLGGRAHPPTSC